MAGDYTLSAQLEKALTEYTGEVENTVAAACSMAGKKCKRDIVAGSPVQTGRYKKGWVVRNEWRKGLTSTIVHNKTDYQLTHLLEKPHVIKNQFGQYGRTTLKPHIAPAAEEAEKYLQELLEREL